MKSNILCVLVLVGVSLYLYQRLPILGTRQPSAPTSMAATTLRAPSIFVTHGGVWVLAPLPPLPPAARRWPPAAACDRPAALTPAGGPFPVIGGPGHAPLTQFLKEWPKSLPERPKALLVVSGHWGRQRWQVWGVAAWRGAAPCAVHACGCPATHTPNPCACCRGSRGEGVVERSP